MKKEEIELVKKIHDLTSELLKIQQKEKYTQRILIENDRQKIVINGEIKDLTENEIIVLQELISSKNNFCTNNELCQKLYNYQYDKSTANSLRATISRLRKKLKGLIKIKSVHKGYILIGGLEDD